MHSFPGKTWSAGKDEEEANKLKEHLDEHKDKHGEHEHMHYHG